MYLEQRRRWLNFTGLLFGCCLVAGGAPAIAEQANLNPVADAFVAAAQPTNNYGEAGVVSVAAPGLANGEFQGLLRFDSSTAKAAFDAAYGVNGWYVQNASLRVCFGAATHAIFNFQSPGQFSMEWVSNDTWTEGTGRPVNPTTDGITFATLPSFLGPSDEALGTFAYDGSTSGCQTISLQLSPALASDISAGNLVSLRLFPGDAGVSLVFRSRDHTGGAGDPPVLSIVAAQSGVPAASEWGLIVLLGLVLCGGAIIFRRRNTGMIG